MIARDSRYKRLKVGGPSMAGRTTYWLGPDHLLAVNVSYFTESYRRYYFADIGAILVRVTRRRAWEIAACAFSLLLLGAWLLSMLSELPAAGGGSDSGLMTTVSILGCVTLLPLGLIVNHLVRGPSCVCHIHTAVQTRVLEGVTRKKSAEALVEILRPLVLRAQASANTPGTATGDTPGGGAEASLPRAEEVAGEGVAAAPETTGRTGSPPDAGGLA